MRQGVRCAPAWRPICWCASREAGSPPPPHRPAAVGVVVSSCSAGWLGHVVFRRGRGIQEVARPSRVDLHIAEAVERQTAAMRELSRRAFPEPDVVPDDVPTSIGQARAQHRRQAAATEAAALRRARAERAQAADAPALNERRSA